MNSDIGPMEGNLTLDELRKAEVRVDPRIAYMEKLAAVQAGSKRSEVESKRLMRAWSRVLRIVSRPRHLTKTGYAVRPLQKAGQSAYLMTPREHSRRKTRRQMQRASRRANRG